MAGGARGWWTMEWLDDTAAAAVADHTPFTSTTKYREGILAVYYQLLLKPIYTTTEKVLFLNLIDIKLCEEGGARTHAVTKKSWQPLPAARP